MREETKLKAYEDGKAWAIGLGVTVYIAAIVLVLVFSETVVTSKMDGFFRLIAQLALVLVACNSLAIPIALHFWAVTGLHRGAGIMAYIIDVAFLGINAVVAFGYIQGHMPEWGDAYLPYIPLAAVASVAEWAILFVLDPGEVATRRLAAAWQSAALAVVMEVESYISSDSGKQDVIQRAANDLIDEMTEGLSGKVHSTIKRPGTIPKPRGPIAPLPILASGNGHKKEPENFTNQP